MVIQMIYLVIRPLQLSTLMRSQYSLLFLLFLLICLLKAQGGLTECTLSSETKTKTKSKVAVTVTRYDDQEVDEFGVNKKPFYFPEDPIGDYTVTETFITTEIVKTSRIINIGTSTTITKSLTLATTTTLTSTFLDVSVKYATTKVELILTVDGGLKTSTTFVDTTTLVTVTVTPVAGTILNLVTKFSRITDTVFVTLFDTITTGTTVLVTETLVIPSFSLEFIYSATQTIAITSYVISTFSEVRTFLAYTNTITPAGFTVRSDSFTSYATISSIFFQTLGTSNYATTFNAFALSTLGTDTFFSTATVPASDLFDLTDKTLTTFTIA